MTAPISKQRAYYLRNREPILEARRRDYAERASEIRERRKERAKAVAAEKRLERQSGLVVASGGALPTAAPADEPLLASVHTLYGSLIHHCLLCYEPTPAAPAAKAEHLALHQQELAEYDPDRPSQEFFKGRRTAKQTMLLAQELRARGLIEAAVAARLDVSVKHLRAQIRKASAATS